MIFQNRPVEQRIFKGSKYNLLVVNRAEIESFRPPGPVIVISVTDPAKPAVEIFESPFLLGVLRLEFDDLDDANKFKFSFEESDDVLMEAAHAEKILSFVGEYLPQAPLIVCQCEQGVSRSPAIAGALSKILQDEDEYFLDNFWANRRVYRLIIEQETTRRKDAKLTKGFNDKTPAA